MTETPDKVLLRYATPIKVAGASIPLTVICQHLREFADDYAAARGSETIEAYFARQIEWSRETFGPSLRTGGVVDHIRKELREIEVEPHDLSEWVDVIIVAMDGYWRHGGTVESLMPSLLAKQTKNMARAWPDWRTLSESAAIEHDRSGERAAYPDNLVNDMDAN